ncbi:MAG: DUF3857 domain-containing protein, partial [Candidatus Eisenbacteria sp.]|nr:DUF3857 domain-containing protein [Candidatus Eisenbacteria bacterium]
AGVSDADAAGAIACGQISAHPRICGSGRTSPEMLEMIAGAGDSGRWLDVGRVIVFDSTRVEMEDSGLNHRFHHTLHKILTLEGARDGASLRFDYDPATNMIEIRQVRIHRPDSTFVEIDPAGAIDAFAPAHSIYWGGRMKVLALSRLEPGDAVEVLTYKKGFQIAYLMEVDEDEERFIPPMRGHYYDSVLFGEGSPFLAKHYQLIVPREKIVQYSVYNGEVYSALAYTDSSSIYEWWATDQEAVAHEPREPARSDFVPKVVMATVPDWPEKSRWFFTVNDPVFAWNEEIQQKVDELIRGLRTDDEKFAALTHWVADNIRYSGLNMGKGEGYTIHPSVMTWEERCGVCKDIAGMLVTFVRAAGYTTYPAMTMAGARVEAVPADQFNHCVVAVKLDDGSYRMLDPTWVPQSRDVWSKAEGEQHYVIGSPEGEELCAIRSFAAEESPVRITFRTKLDKAGTLEGEVELVGDGYMDRRLRGALAYRGRPQWDAYVARMLSAISPSIELIEAEFDDFRNYDKPMRYVARFRIGGYAAVTDSTIDFRIPSLRFLADCQRFVRVVGLAPAEERAHPALFWATCVAEVEEKLTLPRSYEFETELPECDLKRDAATLSAESEAKGKKLQFHQRLSLEKRTVPAEEWNDLAELADSLNSLAATRIHGKR